MRAKTWLNKGPEITYFTGDGGGDALGVSSPYRRIGTPQALLDYVIERYQIWPLDQVAALTRLTGQDIKAELAEHLASYPETAPHRKYKHFFCLEVATKMYHEGEDRNRHFFWSATPFYAFEFFHYAMNCPDRDKQGYRLYREFLAQLHPAAGDIDYAGRPMLRIFMPSWKKSRGSIISKPWRSPCPGTRAARSPRRLLRPMKWCPAGSTPSQ